MPNAMPNDLEAIGARLREAVTLQLGVDVEITGMRPLYGGACQDNLRVDIIPANTGQPERLVLRADAPSSLPGSLGRREEFEVISAAVAAGVRTPAARWLAEGVVREGSWSYLLDFVDGGAIGRKVLSSPALETARESMPGELAAILARVHSVTPETAPELPILDEDPLLSVDRWLGPLTEPHPALTLALRWLDAHRPPEVDKVLVHGDYRTGNFMVAPPGVTGVLDWEFAHWGSPYEDLAWICVRDWRFGVDARPVGGFASRWDFYRAYEEATGATVDPEAVHWWEVMGNVRWAAGCACQGLRYLSGEAPDIELIAIARRAAEMEWEALRLIATGPTWATGGR